VSNTNGAHTIDRQQVITYAPDALRSFFLYGFEWIDNFHFLQEPSTFLGARAVAYESVAKERFKEAGWEGDGDVNLLWLPPFVFPLEMQVAPEGVVVWHVKQVEDGVSYLLSPIALPFPEFDGAH
jgi:hypothetical protein